MVCFFGGDDFFGWGGKFLVRNWNLRNNFGGMTLDDTMLMPSNILITILPSSYLKIVTLMVKLLIVVRIMITQSSWNQPPPLFRGDLEIYTPLK